MEACLKASNEVNAETSADNPDFKKICESQQAFRNDENLWWQVAEYTYDSFMIRNRAQRLIRKPLNKIVGRPIKPALMLFGPIQASPLSTLVEPVQTGFSERAPSWFGQAPRVEITGLRGGGVRYQKQQGG